MAHGRCFDACCAHDCCCGSDTSCCVLDACQFVLIVHALLLVFDDLPGLFVVVGILSHVAYHMLLRTFPMLSFTSLEFVLSCGASRLARLASCSCFSTCFRRSGGRSEPCCVALALHKSHLLSSGAEIGAWWHEFCSVVMRAAMVPAGLTHLPSAWQAFFFVCVWLVPFAFCLSLSVTDNVLPGNAGTCCCTLATHRRPPSLKHVLSNRTCSLACRLQNGCNESKNQRVQVVYGHVSWWWRWWWWWLLSNKAVLSEMMMCGCGTHVGLCCGRVYATNYVFNCICFATQPSSTNSPTRKSTHKRAATATRKEATGRSKALAYATKPTVA